MPGLLITSRAGGVSTGRYASANLADHVGDDPAAVTANRDRLARRLPRPAVFMRQVHGAAVTRVSGGAAEPGECDALVTTTPGLPLAVLVADCLPVVLRDVAAGVLAVVHAGRRGVVAGAVPAAVAAMLHDGARADRLQAVVGPGIGGCCYEVARELAQQVAAVVPQVLTTTRSGAPALDLRAGVRAQLTAAGVPTGQIADQAPCTAESPELFSYRRDQVTGRFAVVAWL